VLLLTANNHSGQDKQCLSEDHVVLAGDLVQGNVGHNEVQDVSEEGEVAIKKE
jgi:hypothetical protein